MRRAVGHTAWVIFGALLTTFLLAPAVITALYSTGESRYFQFPASGYSLIWYGAFFRSPVFRAAMVQTALLTVIVTPGCLVIALATSHALARNKFPGKQALDAALLSPLVVPGVVTGVAFLSLFRILGQDSGLLRMSVAMLVVCFPFALRALAANYADVDVRTEEAARDLGAGHLETYVRVTLPQLKPGLLAGAVFVAVEVVDNFSVNVFLVGIGNNTLPIAAYQHIRDFDDPLVAVMSTLLSLLSLGLVLLLSRVAGMDRLVRRP